MLIFNVVQECAELVDDLAMKAMNQYGKFPRKWPERDTVLFKFQGSVAVREDTSHLVQEVSEKYGGTEYTHVLSEEEGNILWTDRKNALFGILSIYPGYKGYITDVW